MLAIAKALDLLEELVEPDYEPADVPDVARRSAPTPTDPGEVYLEGFREGFRQGVAWATRARPPGPPQLQARSLDEAVGHRPEQPAAPAPPGRTRGRRAG